MDTARFRKKIRLGELLVEARALTEEQLRIALAEQRRSGRKLGRVLVDLGFVTEGALHDFLARHLQLPFMDLRQVQLDPEVVRLLPEAHARRFRAIVLQRDAKGLLVGMADPTDLFSFDELQGRLRQPLRLALVGESDLLKTLDAVYRATDQIASIAQELRDELREGDVDLDQLTVEEGSAEAPVIRLLQTMFHEAVRLRASDIHIEPGETVLRIRQRIDGVLSEQVLDGRRVAAALVTRIKLMCGLDIAEKRLPQDGRFTIRVKDAALDVRVATMPTQHGESVVMRLLDQSAALLTLDELGMPPAVRQTFERLIERSAGLVLVTGPTGSGKTTTLYSALNKLNDPGIKIITVEDPVEYRLERVNQVQVNTKIGLDFGRVLRTVLRQDPDVVLVGEMRDKETVDIGLRAAMTGHLVFSTLHTINALATVNRLVDMGAAGYQLGAALHGIVAQRLVRRLCDNCRHPTELEPNEAAWLGTYLPAGEVADFKPFTGTGCTYCNLTGTRGRVGVYEILEMDRGLADAMRREDLEAFARLARSRAAFVPLARGAIELAAKGAISVAEAMAVSSGVEELTDPDAAPLQAGG